MKLNIDKQKGAEAVSNLLQKTSDVSKRAVSEVQKGAVALSEKAKQDSYLRRLKKYNPLFPDVYKSNDFCLPNMIIIVDDAVRRGIDVCEGAIGWRSSDSGMEVLHLYDEAVKMSGLQFVPAPTCDTIYYVDKFDRNRFISIDCIFNKAHEERLAELEHVAHSLGAKSCSIEITEMQKQINVAKRKSDFSANANIKGAVLSNEEHMEIATSSQDTTKRSGRITSTFEGSNIPRRPKLKWFAQEENIKKLIDMRLKGDNTIKSKVLEIYGSSAATMSHKAACSIDGAASKLAKIKGKSNMETQCVTEHSTKLVFCVEF